MLQHYAIPCRSVLPHFVPASFPDVGRLPYTDPVTGERNLVIDSSQSVANHLELTMLSEPGVLKPEFNGLPLVTLECSYADGRTLDVTTLELPHRLASGWICANTSPQFREYQAQMLADFSRLGPSTAVFRRDPNSLLHGVFFSQLDGLTPALAKLTRLMTPTLTAYGVVAVPDGGVAFDPITPTGEGLSISGMNGGRKLSALGGGHLPYAHEIYCAREIVLTLTLAWRRMDALRIPQDARSLLQALATYKVAALLSEPLDLRSMCILEATEIPAVFSDLDAATDSLVQAIARCRDAGLFLPPTRLPVTLAAEEKAPKTNGKKGNKTAAEEVEA